MDLGRVRSTLFATKLHTVVTILGGLVLLGVLAVVLGIVGAPAIDGSDNRFSDVNDTTTTIESDLHVANPNPIDVRLGGTTIDYALSMNGIRMAEGTRNGVSLEQGRSTINLTTYLDNERIPDWWESHVENGERTAVDVNADVHSSLLGASFGAPTVEEEVETDILSELNSTEPRPINADATLVSDPVMYLNETSATWGEVTDTETNVRMRFTFHNPKSYPIAVSEIGYDVSMNDVAVGEGATDDPVPIGPGQTRTVTATTIIRNEALDEWWVSHIQNDQETDVRINFSARFDLSELGAGLTEIPLDSMAQIIDTDIFGNKDRSLNDRESGTDGATPADGTGTDGSIEDGTGPTDAPTETPTDSPIDDPLDTPTPTAPPAEPSETPTETPTDGGIGIA